MTDKLTIELLCEMLKERGLSCHTHYLHAFWWVGPKLYEAMDNLDGTLTVGKLTIEQAIAATVESRTCEPRWIVQGKTHTQEFWRCECGNCGECFGVEERDSFPFKMTIDKVDMPNYCPHCGVKVADY